MDKVSSTKCEACDEPLIKFFWSKGDIHIALECGNCMMEKSISVDEILADGDLPILRCCGKPLFRYLRGEDDDIILQFRCSKCNNLAYVSLHDGIGSLGDEEEEIGSIEVTVPLSDKKH